MKKGIRLISLLLCIVLLTECSPIQALADDGHILTSEELTAAWALAGLDENAAPYHEGMDFSASMNASQLREWLDELLSNEIAAVKQLHSEMENALAEMREKDPEQYHVLTQENNSYQALMKNYREAEEMRQLLRYYRDKLEQKAGMILQMKERLTGEGCTRSQMLTASREIEDAVDVIRAIRADMAEHSGEWLLSIQRWNMSFRGAANDGLDGWMDSVRSWNRKEPLKTAVSASALYPSGSRQSVMGRLALVTSALADGGPSVDLSVMSKNDFNIVLYSADEETPLQNGTVKVTGSQIALSKLATTDENGLAS